MAYKALNLVNHESSITNRDKIFLNLFYFSTNSELFKNQIFTTNLSKHRSLKCIFYPTKYNLFLFLAQYMNIPIQE
jgi:hypothetical protein